MRLWLTKEQGLPVSQKIPGGEQGAYTYWDPDNWEKARKDMTVVYSDLEEKSTPVFSPGVTGTQVQPQPTTPGVGSGAVQQSQIGQRAAVAAAYQGLGM
jgi:CCR4-NOT transcription complex subunit 2